MARANESVEVHAILTRLQVAGTDKQKSRVVKRGVPESQVLGVSKSLLQREAKIIGRDQKFAEALWRTGYHETRLLAILVAEPEKITKGTCQTWINDLWSWDITDSFARYLLVAREDRLRLIQHCASSNQLYVKRLAFAGIACCVMKQPKFAEVNWDQFIELIRTAANDKRHHVRQAVVWALVELGKVSEATQEEALIVANELIEESGNAGWIGRHARKALELLTPVPERRRLVSSKSQTARKT